MPIFVNKWEVLDSYWLSFTLNSEVCPGFNKTEVKPCQCCDALYIGKQPAIARVSGHLGWFIYKRLSSVVRIIECVEYWNYNQELNETPKSSFIRWIHCYLDKKAKITIEIEFEKLVKSSWGKYIGKSWPSCFFERDKNPLFLLTISAN